MVITYSLKKQKYEKCSDHTQVWEMRSGDGADEVLVDTQLMEMIEKLFNRMQCTKYIISSGYRTPKYDKAVGGNGKGQHTKGKAVDACFYDKNGNIIPAQIVCCVAQDVGFKGIANITKNYRFVHLDMRDSGTYFGDETVNLRTVTKDFYKYYGISKDLVEKYTGVIQRSVDDLAREVIAGKWGNGATRKKRLTEAGFNYALVQNRVNEILRTK